MPVYDGNSKTKDLYYGGTKIKEAYYGSTKVYTGVKPLYYCYIANNFSYIYLTIKPTTNGTYAYRIYDTVGYGVGSKASSSSMLNSGGNASISNTTDSSFVANGYTFIYSQNDDLYT